MMWKIALFVLALVATVGSVENLVGGYQDLDFNNEGVRNALNFSVVQHNQNSNDIFLRKVAEVIEAEGQALAGFKYRLTVMMVRTSCRKGGAEEVCEIHEDAKPYECRFTVWSRPWLKDLWLIEQTC